MDRMKSNEKKQVRKENSFEMAKSFGLGVLLKLTKTSVGGIKIWEREGKLRSNVGRAELCLAVDKTIKAHHINLKVK